MSKTASYEPPSMDPVIPSPQLACTQAISISEDRTARLRSVSFKRFSTTWLPKPDFTRSMSDIALQLGCGRMLGSWVVQVERSFEIMRPCEFHVYFGKSLKWDRTAQPDPAEKRPVAAAFRVLELRLLAQLIEHAPERLDPQTMQDNRIKLSMSRQSSSFALPRRCDFTDEGRAFIAAVRDWMRNVKRLEFMFELPTLSAHELLAIRARARSTPYPT